MRRKKFVFKTIILSFLTGAPTVFARDEHLMFPLDKAIAEGKAKGKIQDDIKLYFSGQKHGEPTQKFGTFTSNRKTNAVGKSDQEACNWAFLSTIMSLQERARKEGGNAVIDIKSVYKGTVKESATEFMCGAGSMMAGVALEGRIAKIP